MAQLTLTKLYLACIEFNYLAGDSYMLIVQKILAQTELIWQKNKNILVNTFC